MNLQLEYGSLVADVPTEGRGFRVRHRNHELTEHGTRFGLKAPQDHSESPVEVAVFQGEVEVRSADFSGPIRLIKNDAVILTSESSSGVSSIPFDRSKFLRELPHSEIPWAMPPIPRGESTILEMDVSELVRGPGRYFAVFKWLLGEAALSVAIDIELRNADGVEVHDRMRARTMKFGQSFYFLRL